MRCVPVLLLAALPASALAAGGVAAGHTLLWLAIMLMAARVFAPIAARLGFPAVLGELLIGVALGNLTFVGVHFFEGIPRDPIILFLGELGVLVLLLQIGLETRLRELVRVGGTATVVGCAGIVAPFLLGAFLVGPFLLPGQERNTYLFLGATLAATSVGITGRVFRDLGRLDTPAARIVLGAAVIDDVLGLVILAVVSALVETGSVDGTAVAVIIAEAVLFLAGSIGVGRLLVPHAVRALARFDPSPSMLFALILATALAMAWLAQFCGLAPIVGAFAAGLLFEPVFFNVFERPAIVREIEPLLPEGGAALADKLQPILLRHTHRQHEDLIESVSFLVVPVFFVLTGMQVDLHALAEPATLAVALGLTAAAIAGKLCAGVFARGAGGWIVGWGMVPRGEVGLVFAMVGKQLGVIGDALFSVIVAMVILTTLVTPPVLTWLLRRRPA